MDTNGILVGQTQRWSEIYARSLGFMISFVHKKLESCIAIWATSPASLDGLGLSYHLAPRGLTGGERFGCSIADWKDFFYAAP
jgi:hypothetical protein